MLSGLLLPGGGPATLVSCSSTGHATPMDRTAKAHTAGVSYDLSKNECTALKISEQQTGVTNTNKLA